MRYLLTLLLVFSLSFTSNAASLESLNKEVNNQVKKIDELNLDIKDKNASLLMMEANLNSTQSDLNKQYEDMKLRIKYIYEQGDTSFLETIFTSKDFSDIVNNVEYKKEMIDYDRNKLQYLKDTINDIEETKNELKKEKQDIEKLKKDTNEKKKELQKLVEEKKSELKKEEIKKVNKTIQNDVETTYKEANDYGYSDQQIDLICAIVAQECSTSYEGSLAVITCAMNRCDSKQWSYLGKDPLSQLCARGQFCYSIDRRHRNRLHGNYEKFVKKAVMDCLDGKRNHRYLSFRGYRKPNSVNIGDNWYFNEM